MKKVLAIMETANRDLQGQRWINRKRAANASNTARAVLRDRSDKLPDRDIYYVKRDFTNAFLTWKVFARNWVAMWMLAITYEAQQEGKMLETFEKTVRWNAKESLAWSLYAYCVNEGGDSGKAKEILSRGLKKIPGDERIAHNLEALKEGKKMKMKNYGDMWLQFHLEKQSVMMKQQAAAMGGMANGASYENDTIYGRKGNLTVPFAS
jgi:hypothetical protein